MSAPFGFTVALRVTVESVIALAAPVTTMGAGASSLVMVPRPWPSARTAFVGALRFTKNVSLGSKITSPLMVTETCLLTWPAVKVRSVPGAAT